MAEACAGKEELRADVLSLLAHDARADDAFMRPADRPRVDWQADLLAAANRRIGQRIGAFTIKRVIAAGGMGTVYEALQDDPKRTVALKVMHRNVTSHSALRRFQFESLVLGRLRHPNVAQVYSAGMHDEDGERVPYFAMEFVPEARTIIEYAKDRALDTRARLTLFIDVCDAVHHGHQKGVIHRDLKPGNVLVDSSGTVKVIDFGVARGTDADLAITTQQTYVGQLVGTMQYMSPEQCDGDPYDLDIRTDVYSLGVVLYELLAGVPPYDISGTTIYPPPLLLN
ncbi:MAG: serine/threonine protein kinase [Planctomycetes bacterium]|nr:serine/threonine protein kinase [Planctomycetota bacterium]